MTVALPFEAEASARLLIVFDIFDRVRNSSVQESLPGRSGYSCMIVLEPCLEQVMEVRVNEDSKLRKIGE